MEDLIYQGRFWFHRYLISVVRWLIGFVVTWVSVGILLAFNAVTLDVANPFWYSLMLAARLWLLASAFTVIIRAASQPGYLSVMVTVLSAILVFYLMQLPVLGRFSSMIIGVGYAIIFVFLYIVWARTSKIPPSEYVRIAGGNPHARTERFNAAWRDSPLPIRDRVITSSRGNVLTHAEALIVLDPEYYRKHRKPGG